MNELPAVKGWFLDVVSNVVSAGKNAAEQAAHATEGTGEMLNAAYEKVGSVGSVLKSNLQSQLVPTSYPRTVPMRRCEVNSINDSTTIKEILSEFPLPPSPQPQGIDVDAE
eukprot:TRINITY_DN9745_c0_g1_i1.p1 TRINITY_DN9745_c0_g1~~TRINITY_DN9745_c0_g1_i1.p1  ORF type:complete len:111 (+),score=21.30 TRINITY_DN9745_c0_g1_i1:53-385(+)